jgi:hypothetical protein
MSSIAAGTTLTTALVSTGDTTGELVLKTNGTTTAVTIDTSQNVAVVGQIVAAAGTVSLPSVTTTGDVNTGIFFPAADTIAFAEGGAEAMRIDSSGNLLVGKTSLSNITVGVQLQTAGGAAFVESTTSDGPLTQFVNINGTITNGYRYCSFRLNSGATEKGTITINTGTNQVNYNQTSDRRLKTNIQPSASALGVLAQVEVVSFDMIEGGHTNFGVIAQDLEAVFPEAVSPGDSGEIVERAWGVDTSNLVPALVKAIQELKAINDAQASRIETLEAKVAALETGA